MVSVPARALRADEQHVAVAVDAPGGKKAVPQIDRNVGHPDIALRVEAAVADGVAGGAAPDPAHGRDPAHRQDCVLGILARLARLQRQRGRASAEQRAIRRVDVKEEILVEGAEDVEAQRLAFGAAGD